MGRHGCELTPSPVSLRRDVAVMNEDGYVKIVGREKDMVIRGGENIYPTEVEDFLMTHPDVLEASVSAPSPPPRSG